MAVGQVDVKTALVLVVEKMTCTVHWFLVLGDWKVLAQVLAVVLQSRVLAHQLSFVLNVNNKISTYD